MRNSRRRFLCLCSTAGVGMFGGCKSNGNHPATTTHASETQSPTATETTSATKTAQPAEFAVTDLQIQPNPARQAHKTTITATVSNEGETAGTTTLEILVDDAVVAEKELTVTAGSSTTLSTTLRPAQVGQQTVQVGTASRSLEVVHYPPTFVQTAGTEFVAGDSPFYFAGFGDDHLIGEVADRDHTDVALSAASAMASRVIRSFAFCRGGPEEAGCFQPRPGEYSERAFKHMDYFLYRAKLADIRLILPLTDYGTGHNAISQYLEWSPTADSIADFYTDETTRRLYKQYVETFLTRTNTITGVEYRNDPTIMMWELGNEMHTPRDESGDIIYDWVKEMSQFIKRLDDNHLVATGGTGLYKDDRDDHMDSDESGAYFLRNNSIDTIDACSVHLYTDQPEFGDESTFTPAEGNEWIRMHTRDAHRELNKPVYLGEYGYLVDRSADDIAAQLERRNEVFSDWHATMLEAGTNGALAWNLDAHTPVNVDTEIPYPGERPGDKQLVKILTDFGEQMRKKPAHSSTTTGR